MVIFHSYVKLPERILVALVCIPPRMLPFQPDQSRVFLPQPKPRRTVSAASIAWRLFHPAAVMGWKGVSSAKTSLSLVSRLKSNCLTLLYRYAGVSICSCRFTAARLSRSAHQTYNAKLLNTSNKWGFLHSKSRSVKQESFVEVLNRKELRFGMINHDKHLQHATSLASTIV